MCAQLQAGENFLLPKPSAHSVSVPDYLSKATNTKLTHEFVSISCSEHRPYEKCICSRVNCRRDKGSYRNCRSLLQCGSWKFAWGRYCLLCGLIQWPLQHIFSYQQHTALFLHLENQRATLLTFTGTMFISRPPEQDRCIEWQCPKNTS